MEVDGQRAAITRICRWLDHWERQSDGGAWWPEIITLDELRRSDTSQPGPLRPSWCYGTPGIARAQQLAARALGDTARQRKAETAFTACVSGPEQLRILYRAGVSQREIARRTGQSQSEVSEIMHRGRQVRDVQVLERIADGLPVPRPYLRLLTHAPHQTGAYPETQDNPDPDPEVDEEVKRRILIAVTSLAALGEVVQGMGEVAELALPRSQDEPLPARITLAHVHAIEAITKQLRDLTRQYGGQTHLFAAAARHYTRWLAVPATDAVQARFTCALAELHTEAGWACHDAGVQGTGYFTRALRLADRAGDAYGIANTAWHAGIALVRRGHPDQGLKVLQLGQFT